MEHFQVPTHLQESRGLRAVHGDRQIAVCWIELNYPPRAGSRAGAPALS